MLPTTPSTHGIICLWRGVWGRGYNVKYYNKDNIWKIII